jgi:hypothetical protein
LRRVDAIGTGQRRQDRLRGEQIETVRKAVSAITTLRLAAPLPAIAGATTEADTGAEVMEIGMMSVLG